MRWIPLFAVLLLAGCTASPKTSTPTTDTTVAAVPVHTLIPYNETGCSETIGVIMVDFPTAQKALPAGLVPRDAAELIGAPAPTGMAGLFVNAVTCPDGGEAAQGIFIESPTVANVTLAKSTLDFYEVAYAIGNASKLTALQAFGVAAFALDIDHKPTQTPAAATGTVTVRLNSTIAHTFTFTASGAVAQKIVARFWSQTPQGLAIIDYNLAETAMAGSLSSCSIGGPLAAATGVTSCVGHPTAALHFGTESWTGAIRLEPAAKFS